MMAKIHSDYDVDHTGDSVPWVACSPLAKQSKQPRGIQCYGATRCARLRFPQLRMYIVALPGSTRFSEGIAIRQTIS